MRLEDLLLGAGYDFFRESDSDDNIPKNSTLRFGNKSQNDLKNIEIRNITESSRDVREGDVFVCIAGLHADGHSFIDTACQRGAALIVADKSREKDISCDAPIMFVDNTRVALANLFASFYANPQKALKIIGITGTNGKTTTARMLYEILKKYGLRCGLIGTTGSISPSGRLDIRSLDECANMTTPEPLELYKILSVMRGDGAEYVVMEVSSHSLTQGRVEPIEFYVALFSNLTRDHLDFHGDMESYFLAKSKLFYKCKKAIINIDDMYGRRIAESIASPIKCSAEGREAQYMATEIKYRGESGVEYKLSSRLSNLRVRTSIPGKFTVYNSLLAISCALEIGVPSSIIRYAMMSLAGSDGRIERVNIGNAPFSVFIDYAHTPDALENLLLCARSFKNRKSRIVLLFGCGGDRDRDKRKIMGSIASSLADFVIITSDNPRSEDREKIIFDILLGVDKESRYTVIPDREAAIKYAIANARAGDIILLAGKGHEKYEIADGKKIYFNEREIVERAYIERLEGKNKEG